MRPQPLFYGRADWTAVAFLALLSVGVSCKRTGAAAVAKQEPLIAQTLANLPLRISLPATVQTRPLGSGVRIAPKVMERSPRVMDIIPFLAEQTPNEDRKTHTFRSGLVLRYKLISEAAVGSGGDEQQLKGIVEVDGQRFQVTCYDQAEWPKRVDAEWCLPWLATLQAEVPKRLPRLPQMTERKRRRAAAVSSPGTYR